MPGIDMSSFDTLFQRLARSPFRQRFHLGNTEYRYYVDKGAARVQQHAADFIAERLAPAEPANDGKQTPMRGHPVFIAQHATATCCRGCLSKWHGIAQHAALTDRQQQYIVDVLFHWLTQEMQRPEPKKKAGKQAPPANEDPQIPLL